MDAFANLGIDAWGIVLYLGNFGVLLWLMHRFVYKPLIKTVDKRRETIKENIEEAENLRAELQEAKTQADKDAQEKEASMQARFAEAKRVVKEQAAAILSNAEARREGILRDASDQAQAVKDRALDDAQAETKRRIEQVVMHVLKDAPKDMVKKSVESSWAALEK